MAMINHGILVKIIPMGHSEMNNIDAHAAGYFGYILMKSVINSQSRWTYKMEVSAKSYSFSMKVWFWTSYFNKPNMSSQTNQTVRELAIEELRSTCFIPSRNTKNSFY